jgi:hypothetical protein
VRSGLLHESERVHGAVSDEAPERSLGRFVVPAVAAYWQTQIVG